MRNEFDFERKLNKLEKYLKSEENIKECEPFQQECQRFTEIAEKYNGRFKAIFNKLNCEVVRKEHSVGGELLHRGYYCPSPVADIVIGNAKRGKLLKRITRRSNPTYEYGFDKGNNLITACQTREKEIIIRKDEVEIGLIFLEDHGVISISECIYSGDRIQSYIYCLYNPFEKNTYEYQREIYKYSKEGLKTVDWIQFLNTQGAPLLEQQQYHFQHDDNGYLSKYAITEYAITEYGKDLIRDAVFNGYEFNVYIKRKV